VLGFVYHCTHLYNYTVPAHIVKMSVVINRYMPWHALLWWTALYGVSLYYIHQAAHATYAKLFYYFTYEEYMTINIFYIAILFMFVRQYFVIFADWYVGKKTTDCTAIEIITAYAAGRSIERCEHNGIV
jgi:hypothetical protein